MELPISLFSILNKVSISACQGLKYCKFTIWAHVKIVYTLRAFALCAGGAPPSENACYGLMCTVDIYVSRVHNNKSVQLPYGFHISPSGWDDVTISSEYAYRYLT